MSSIALLADRSAQSNLLVDEQLNIFISDLGMAAYADSASNALASRREGNPRWMAPELLRALDARTSVRLTFASDIYSFAMVCVEVSTIHSDSASFDHW